LLQKQFHQQRHSGAYPEGSQGDPRCASRPLFGAGPTEAIRDATILANVDVVQTDGVKGRAAMIKDPVSGETQDGAGLVGKLNRKPSSLGFSADAYLNEMGITNRFFPTENAPNGDQALLAKVR